MTHLLPLLAASRLESLLKSGWTGKIELDAKDGSILAWSFTGAEPDEDGTTRTVTVRGRHAGHAQLREGQRAAARAGGSPTRTTHPERAAPAPGAVRTSSSASRAASRGTGRSGSHDRPADRG